MQLGEQDRLQRILEELEGAYRQEPVLPAVAQQDTGKGLPHGVAIEKKKIVASATAPVADPKMERLLQELETAYPSNYQMLRPGAIPSPEKTPSGMGDVLKGMGQTVHTIGAGGYQGLAGWMDLLDKLSEQGLTKEYQGLYGHIVKAPVPGSESMTPQQIREAKMAMFEKLGPLDEWLKNNKAKFLGAARDALTKQAQAHAAAGIPMTENKVMEVIRQVYQGLGQAGVDVPIYMMGGPAALPIVGAARGLAEKGTAEGVVLGGIEGAMLQTMIHAVGILPSGVQLPTWFGMGAAITPGGVQDRVVGGLTWAGLGLSGARGKEKVTVREFIERYPKWQKRVDDNAAMKVLQTLTPEVTPEVMAQHGGPKAMLDKFIGLKDKFASVMELFKKSGQDPAALQAMLNKPEMIPLFREMMGVTEERPSALPPARPETIRAGTPARFKVTETGQVVGTEFPEDILLRLGYREQELGRRMTPAELAGFFEAQRGPAVAAKPEAPAKGKEAEKPKPEAPPMVNQMLAPEEAAKLDVDGFKSWANPRFRITYDPTNDSDMAAYTELAKALGLRGDDTILRDVAGRLKKPEPPKTPPAAPAAAAPPVAAPVPVPPAAKAKPESGMVKATVGGSRRKTLRPPTQNPMLTWIRREGGISLDNLESRRMKGEFQNLLEDKTWKRLFRRKGGKTVDELIEAAAEDGRIKEEDFNEFVAALNDEAFGRGNFYSYKEMEHVEDERDFQGESNARQLEEGLERGFNEWLNGKDVPADLEKDVLESVDNHFDAAGLRRTRSENLKRNELLDRMEKDGLLKKIDIEEFLDDTYYDGEKARELAREVMDGKVSEADAMAELKNRVDDMVSTSFKPEELGVEPGEAPADQPWRKTIAEFYDSRQEGQFSLDPAEAKDIHRASVEEALRAGEEVPPEVLADYPDITPTVARVAQKPGEFALSRESFVTPKKQAEAAQPTLFEPGKVERTYPPGFDNRGIGTWPDQESMRRDVNPLITQGWTAEYGQSPEGKVWVRLKERAAAGEGKLERGEVKLPEFGKPKSEEAQLSIDDELSGSLPMKPEPLKTSEDIKVQEPGADKPTEPDEFEAWYKSQMEEYDKATEATPGGQVKAFKLYMKDPTGTERPIGNYSEESRAELEAYAKKKGVEDKIVFGDTFNAKDESVTGPKELDIAKETMDWLDETRVEYEAPAANRKAEDDLLGDKDTERELFAGLPVSKSIRERISRIAEKFDIETLFNRLHAKDTGLATKLYHTRKNREFELAEGAVKDLKTIAKRANGGKDLSPAEYQRIFVLASKPKSFAGLTEAERAKFGPVVRAVRSFFDNYVPRLRAAGVIEDPWPLSAIRRMKVEIQDYKERVGRGARNSDALKEKIKERIRAIGFLESTGMRYVHIPRYWLEAFMDAQPEKAPGVLSELFGKRETLDIEWLANKLLTDGLIKPGDLDVRRIMLMYAHKAGHKIALGEIIKTGKRDGLILPADEAPETWPRLSHRSFPSLTGYRMNPEMLDFLETNYLKRGWKPPTVGAILGTVKMAQFWNPINLSQYSLIQTAWTGAVTSLKMPKVFSKAVRDMMQKTPDYWEANYWGAFPDPFSPTFRQAEARAKTIIGEDPVLKKVLTKLNPYHWSLMAAWKMENFFKMASYNYLREKGFSQRESAQLAALTGGDYATLPPATRKILNTVLFTPSFTIAMMKAQGEMVVAGAKIMAKPKLLFDKTGDAKYLRQMAKGAVFLTGGLVLKNMLMHKLGYKTDVWGLKWSKTVEDEEGNERELVVHMAAPDNVIIRYLNDLRLVGKAENKAQAMFSRLTWKLHPMWVMGLEVLSNKRMDGTPVWNPWDSAFEGRKKALLYATRRVLRITELLPEQGQGNLSKRKAWAALQKDLGQVGGLFMGLYSIPYLRSTQDRRFMYEMTQMLDVFKQANKATPPKDEAEAEERATWLQDSLEKIRKRIEEIRE